MNRDGIVVVERALVSVTNPEGLADFCSWLFEHGQTNFTATDTAARLLNERHLPVVLSAVVTGLPSGFLGGLVKTLHPSIHGGILGAGPEHAVERAEHGIPQFDMVIVNFYDFTAAVEADPSLSSAKKAIDIGGPCMARAAAKNWENVTVVVDPEDYSFVLDDIRQHGGVSREVRYMLATKVFRVTCQLDDAINGYMQFRAPDRPELIAYDPFTGNRVHGLGTHPSTAQEHEAEAP